MPLSPLLDAYNRKIMHEGFHPVLRAVERQYYMEEQVPRDPGYDTSVDSEIKRAMDCPLSDCYPAKYDKLSLVIQKQWGLPQPLLRDESDLDWIKVGNSAATEQPADTWTTVVLAVNPWLFKWG